MLVRLADTLVNLDGVFFIELTTPYSHTGQSSKKTCIRLKNGENLYVQFMNEENAYSAFIHLEMVLEAHQIGRNKMYTKTQDVCRTCDDDPRTTNSCTGSTLTCPYLMPKPPA